MTTWIGALSAVAPLLMDNPLCQWGFHCGCSQRISAKSLCYIDYSTIFQACALHGCVGNIYEKTAPSTRNVSGGVPLCGTLRRGTNVPLPEPERHQLSLRRNECRHLAFRRSWRSDDRWWGNPGCVDHTESPSRRDRGRRPAHVGSRWRQSGSFLHSRRGWARSE